MQSNLQNWISRGSPLTLMALGLLVITNNVVVAFPLTFTIDPDRSYIQAGITIDFERLGYRIPVVSQTTAGIGTPGFSDGLTAALSGEVGTNFVPSTSSLSFGSGQIIPLISGSWAPGPFGADEEAPAQIAGIIDFEPTTGIPGIIHAAIRSFSATYQDDVSLQQVSDNEYHFQTSGSMRVTAGTIDYRGISGFGLVAGAGRSFFIRTSYPVQPQLGTLIVRDDRVMELTVPFLAFARGPLGVGNSLIEPIYADQILEGVVVATAPLPNPIDPVSLDDLFQLIPNVNVDESERFPHASVEAFGQGVADYYTFTIDKPGDEVIIDIDGANFDSEIFLFDQWGQRIGANDDGGFDPGSQSNLDSYLRSGPLTPGFYWIGVGRYNSSSSNGLVIGAFPNVGDAYTLHVTVVPEVSSSILLGMGAAIATASIARRLNSPRNPCAEEYRYQEQR